MGDSLRRRTFLTAASASALGLGAGLGSVDRLVGITPLRADDRAVTPDIVQLRPEIEPVVRWIESTPRATIFEKAVAELKNGLTYRQLLAGLFLAGIRNVKPRPVGFKFHAVLVMNSAHLLGQSAAPDEQLLPLFWALDNFKNSQATDEREGDWKLKPVDESHIPKPHDARAAFIKAMDQWDSDAADVATVGLARSCGAAETMELFWRYGIRDQRDIGHKAIYAMQCWRTLNTIGWQHAEPVLRSLAFGLLDLQGDSRPVAVGPYDANLPQLDTFREDWQTGKKDMGATLALLDVLRTADAAPASKEALRVVNSGVSPESVWDAILLCGNELLIRKPGIVAIHAVTASNALHFIYNNSSDPANRKLALMQAAGWVTAYRDRSGGTSSPASSTPKKGAPAQPAGPIKIDELTPLASTLNGDEKVGEIFNTISTSREKASRLTLSYIDGGGSLDKIFAAQRRMIFHKGKDSHDYKFGAAIWEEVLLASDPKWQRLLAAAAMYNTPGGSANDSPLMNKARDAVKTVLG